MIQKDLAILRMFSLQIALLDPNTHAISRARLLGKKWHKELLSEAQSKEISAICHPEDGGEKPCLEKNPAAIDEIEKIIGKLMDTDPISLSAVDSNIPTNDPCSGMQKPLAGGYCLIACTCLEDPQASHKIDPKAQGISKDIVFLHNRSVHLSWEQSVRWCAEYISLQQEEQFIFSIEVNRETKSVTLEKGKAIFHQWVGVMEAKKDSPRGA